MTVTISRLYNNHEDARAAVRALEDAGVAHGDISILASNADNWYLPDRKVDTYPDRGLDGRDDRAEAAGAGAGIGAMWEAPPACLPGSASWPFPASAPWSPPAGWLPRSPALPRAALPEA
jgi:hypothetical protein